MTSDTPKKTSREERLAEALRANLRRRKSQSRARSDAGESGEAEPGEAETKTGDEG